MNEAFRTSKIAAIFFNDLTTPEKYYFRHVIGRDKQNYKSALGDVKYQFLKILRVLSYIWKISCKIHRKLSSLKKNDGRK